MDDEELDAVIDDALKVDSPDPAEDGVDSDGEDPVERNEYEVAVVLGDILEDPAIRHDLYFESGSESEDESESKREKKRKFTPRCDGMLYQGQKFHNGIAFKEAVMYYALKNQRNIRQKRYDKKKLAFSCVGKGENGGACRWRVYCSIRKGSGKWKIRLLSQEHACVRSGECKMLKVSAIARLFVDNIRDEPEYFQPAKIEDVIFKRWGFHVTRNQAQAARSKALKWIEAEYDDHFKRLRDYANEILISNPGSSVDVQCFKNEKGEDVFERFYVCFDVLRKSWKNTCRPLLGIDGTFLKSKVKGQLLVALGRDGDNRIFPVAWGVVGVENKDNWVWFVKKIQADLELGSGAGYVIVSDHQKGLISAVSSELPCIEHMHCVKHIYANLKSKFGKRDPMKKFIWDLAWSYNETEYDERLQNVKNFDDEVFDWVMKSNPQTWCRAFYKLGPHCEDVENNSTESFNRTIVKARERPFVSMLETIRTLAMTRIAKRKKETGKHVGILTPYASELLRQEEILAKSCNVKATTHGMYQAAISGCNHRVSLDNKSCTCRKWQIRGIPCEHAYGVIMHTKKYVEEFVSGWFHTEVWRKTYEVGIIPPRGARFWPHGTHPPIHYPANTEKKSKKEDRKRGKNESPTKKRPKKAKRVMHCGICGAEGHNCRFHKADKSGTQKQGKGAKNIGKGKASQSQGKGSQTKTKGSQSIGSQTNAKGSQSIGSQTNAKGSQSQQKLTEPD